LFMIILAGCGACAIRVDTKNRAIQAGEHPGDECWSSQGCTDEGGAPCTWCGGQNWYCCSASKSYAKTDNCANVEFFSAASRHSCAKKMVISDSEALVEQPASEKQITTTNLNWGGVMSTLVGLANSLIEAFSEDPADFEYAFDSLNLQGWKLIKLFVPEEHQKSREFKQASRAWKTAFADASEIVEGLHGAWKSRDRRAIIQSVIAFIGTAVKTVAAYDSRDSDLLLAINDLVQEMADSALTFCTSMGWFDLHASNSFLQVGGVKTDFFKQATSLLVPSVQLLQDLLTAFTNEPLDFKLAFESIALEGWKIVELLVPSETQQKDVFSKAHKAWQVVFRDATGVADGIMRGGIGSVARAALQTIDTGLQAAGHLVDANLGTLLDNIRKLLVGIGEAWLKFSHRLGWTA